MKSSDLNPSAHRTSGQEGPQTQWGASFPPGAAAFPSTVLPAWEAGLGLNSPTDSTCCLPRIRWGLRSPQRMRGLV